uniref:Uncharacterized protein n=1 Tax=Ixodes ricinus TaxID=34613 RepID=A0A6B0UMI0_IXORI
MAFAVGLIVISVIRSPATMVQLASFAALIEEVTSTICSAPWVLFRLKASLRQIFAMASAVALVVISVTGAPATMVQLASFLVLVEEVTSTICSASWVFGRLKASLRQIFLARRSAG